MSLRTMMIKTTNRFNTLFSHVPESLVLLVSRFAIASVFWRSVQTKITGGEFLDQSWQFWNISTSTVMLFQYEYGLPLLSPQAAAYAGTFAEFFLSLLIVSGLGTRFAALALLGVTTVIQVFVFPSAWPTHIVWYAVLLVLLRQGGERVSLDALMIRVCKLPDRS